MAIIEQIGRMTYIDANGDQHILYPATKKECVEGFSAIEYFIGDSSKLNTSDKTTLVAAINEVLSKKTDPDESGIDYTEITAAIESALEEAKNSGEFDGRGITSISKTSGDGSAGSIDTYTITYTDNSTSTFTVYNGANGVGEGNIGGTGENGATFIPYVDSDGNLSWSNDKGLPNPQTVNISGKDGKDGIDGKNGVDGKDGTTPQKNIDYFDGNDGFSPIVTIQGVDGGHELTITDINGSKSFIIEDGTNGSNGNDGISATHKWNGTTLTITSASGTSSANLKGEPGNTPRAGVDYYTDTEKSEFVNEIQTYLLENSPKDIAIIQIDNSTGMASHSPSEIKNIMNSGVIPFLYVKDDEWDLLMPLSYFSDGIAVFSSKDMYDTSSWRRFIMSTVCIYPDKSVTPYNSSFIEGQIVPLASDHDTNKYLRITSDGLAWDYLPELPVMFTYGESDLEAGVSALETGKLYFVYE